MALPLSALIVDRKECIQTNPSSHAAPWLPVGNPKAFHSVREGSTREGEGEGEGEMRSTQPIGRLD